MSNKHVTAYYLDARDGRPANEAPLRHGPKRPSDNLKVSVVDRRQSPALIIGYIPSSESLAPGMVLVDKAEHDSLVAEVESWRIDNEMRELQKWRAGMVLSRFQARAVLRRYGYRDQIDQMMAAPETDALAVDAWNDASEFRRLSPMLNGLGAQLGITEDELDLMFEEGIAIEA